VPATEKLKNHPVANDPKRIQVNRPKERKELPDFQKITKRPLIVRIPEEYRHEDCLDKFKRILGLSKRFSMFNPRIDDETFATGNKLLPNEKYSVDIYQINRVVSFDDCLGLIKSAGGILTGIQFFYPLWLYHSDRLPVDLRMVCVDDGQYAPDFHGGQQIPNMCVNYEEEISLMLHKASDSFNTHHGLLIIRKLHS
jgi:hypothetical protein